MENQTAKEFAELNQYGLEAHDEGGFLGIDTDALAEILIKFAQIKVEAALKAAAQKATMKGRGMYTDRDLGENGDSVIVNRDNADDEVWEINKDSILNAYPKELIK